MQTTKPVPVLDIFTIQLDLLQPLSKTQESLELAQPKLYQATDTPAYLALSPPKLSPSGYRREAQLSLWKQESAQI